MPSRPRSVWRRRGDMTVRCGFIGLGIMGKALAGNLAPKGLPTIAAAPAAAAMRQVLAGGAKQAQSVREVAQNADVIGICVPADSHVRAVLCGADGAFADAEAGRGAGNPSRGRIATHP